MSLSPARSIRTDIETIDFDSWNGIRCIIREESEKRVEYKKVKLSLRIVDVAKPILIAKDTYRTIDRNKSITFQTAISFRLVEMSWNSSSVEGLPHSFYF